MANTKIKVRSHYRNGQYVASYLRSHIPTASSQQGPSTADVGNLAGVAEDALNSSVTRTTLVDRNGKFFDLTTGKTVFQDADFSGYSFDGLDLRQVHFINSNIAGAKFTNCKLGDLNLDNSNFTGAKFENCDLSFSKIKKTLMNRGEFINTSIGGPYSLGPYDEKFQDEDHVVHGADFSDTIFKNSKMIDMSFIDSDMQGMKIEDSQIKNLRVVKTKAAGLIANNSSLSKVFLSEVDLSGALIQNSQITSQYENYWIEIDLENAIIKNSELNNVSLKVEHWFYTADDYYTTKIGKWWMDRKLRRENERLERKEKKFWNNTQISGSTFLQCSFYRINLANSKIENSRFVNSVFELTDMRKLNLNRNSFEGSDFLRVQGAGIQAEGANFSGATFGINNKSCDMQNSNFSNAIFDRTTIGSTNVRGSNWKGAKTNSMQVFKSDDPPLTVVENSSGEITTLNQTSYEHYSLYDAAKKIGVTDQAFEFLVLSGAIDVRHNLTKQRIESDFDASINHIPVWQIQNLQPATES